MSASCLPLWRSTVITTTTPGQRKGDLARSSILDVAAKRFASDGYQATSIQHIATELGLAQSTVLYHFPSKRELFAAVIERMADSNEEIALELSEPQDGAARRLEKHFEVNYRWATDGGIVAPLMTGLFYFATFDDDFRAIYTKVLTNARAKILNILMAGIRENVFQLAMEPDIAAALLHDGLIGFILTDLASQQTRGAKARSRAKWKALVAVVAKP